MYIILVVLIAIIIFLVIIINTLRKENKILENIPGIGDSIDDFADLLYRSKGYNEYDEDPINIRFKGILFKFDEKSRRLVGIIGGNDIIQDPIRLTKSTLEKIINIENEINSNLDIEFMSDDYFNEILSKFNRLKNKSGYCLYRDEDGVFLIDSRYKDNPDDVFSYSELYNRIYCDGFPNALSNYFKSINRYPKEIGEVVEL